MRDEQMDYREKNAAEGKAIYIRGKTAKEMREELARPDRETVTVTMTLRQAQALETAIVDLPDLVIDTQHALSALGSALGMSAMSGEDVAPILSLFARALATVDSVEAAALRQFDPLLKDSLARHQQSRSGAEGGE